MTFAEILQDYLVRYNVTQTQFASLIDVKQSQVSEWLSGKCYPSYNALLKMHLYTQEPITYWFGLE